MDTYNKGVVSKAGDVMRVFDVVFGMHFNMFLNEYLLSLV